MKEIQSMTPLMRTLALLLLISIVGATGCSKQHHESDAEGVEEVSQADTAEVEASGSVENLPAIDEAAPAPEETAQTQTDAPQAAETPATETQAGASPSDLPQENVSPVEGDASPSALAS